VLLAWMALGRTDPEHFFHPYLASLPPGPVGCRFWSEKDRQCLRGTELGPDAELSASSMMEQQHGLQLQRLIEQFPAISKEQVLWAFDMYRSRRLPITVCPWLSADGSGFLVPLLDVLNHREGIAIEWRASNAHVEFALGYSAAAGEELYNNYGALSNRSFMINHGFALPENEFDLFQLRLPDGSGPFWLRRANAVEQFPAALWRRLAGLEFADRDFVEIDLEQVKQLFAVLNRQAMSFIKDACGMHLVVSTTSYSPNQKMAQASIYKEGQRKLVLEAIEAVQAMILELRSGE